MIPKTELLPKPEAKPLAVVQDIWGSHGKSSEISVITAATTNVFPYDDEQQRLDQLRNAEKFARDAGYQLVYGKGFK